MSWVAAPKDKNPWIQAELQSFFTITGLETKGRADFDQWVTQYKMSYGTFGDDWTVYSDDDGTEKANYFVSQIFCKWGSFESSV